MKTTLNLLQQTQVAAAQSALSGLTQYLLMHVASDGNEFKREKILAEALTHVGYTEGKNNDNIFGRHYGINHQPWCGSFVSFCYERGAGIDLPATNKGIKGCHYVPLAYNFWKKNKNFTDNPKRGDIVIFEFNGDKKSDHIGIFDRWIDKNNFYAVEGNTSFDEKGSQSNGGAVAYKSRNRSLVHAFVCVKELYSPKK